jgi:hypothetical protein
VADDFQSRLHSFTVTVTCMTRNVPCCRLPFV